MFRPLSQHAGAVGRTCTVQFAKPWQTIGIEHLCTMNAGEKKYLRTTAIQTCTLYTYPNQIAESDNWDEFFILAPGFNHIKENLLLSHGTLVHHKAFNQSRPEERGS